MLSASRRTRLGRNAKRSAISDGAFRYSCDPEATCWVGAMKTPLRDLKSLPALGKSVIAMRCGSAWEHSRNFTGLSVAPLGQHPRSTHLIQSESAPNILVMVIQTPIPFPNRTNIPERISFNRRELSAILSVYGRMVAAGEWRDYGISTLKDVAVFSVFRRTAEYPLYRIEKRPKLSQRQGEYAVIGLDGRVLKRGHDLKTVLRVLEKKLIRSID